MTENNSNVDQSTQKAVKTPVGKLAAYLREWAELESVARDTASDENGYLGFTALKANQKCQVRAENVVGADGFVNIQMKEGEVWEWIDAMPVFPA
jgi:hypothetical protein